MFYLAEMVELEYTASESNGDTHLSLELVSVCGVRILFAGSTPAFGSHVYAERV